jgi:hypothetical protein
MIIDWQYPLYVIPLGGGYVSVVDSPTADAPQQMLAVFTSLPVAESFVQVHQLDCAPKPLHNGREFGWLLQSLRAPVTQVAFDPEAGEQRVTSRWTVGVQQLLEHHLQVDSSPWNYPVFVVRQQEGYASIEGHADDGRSLRAVCLFTSSDKAQAYLQDTGLEATVQSLPDRQAARQLLEQMVPDVTAVALDAVVSEGKHSARYCFPIQVLLDKYLVVQEP